MRETAAPAKKTKVGREKQLKQLNLIGNTEKSHFILSCA